MYIGPKSRTERPRKTKIGTGVAHVTRDSETTFKVKRTKVNDLLTLKVVSESRVTWATPVPILVFLGLSVLDLGPMYTTNRRQTKVLVLWP